MNRRTILSIFLLSNLFAAVAHGENAPRELYARASGDRTPKDLYVLFAFSENACLNCLSEITAVWCPVLQAASNNGRIGAAVVFQSPRTVIARKMAADFQQFACGIPFLQDVDGALIKHAFTANNRAQMIIARSDGSVIIQRGIGETDEFSERVGLESGGAGPATYIDSLLRHAVPPGQTVAASRARKAVNGSAPGTIGKLRLVRSIKLQGTDTAGMPYAEQFSAERGHYALISGLSNSIYEFDSTGRKLAQIDLPQAVRPSCLQLASQSLYMITPVPDTVLIDIKGEDSIYAADDVLRILQWDHNRATIRSYAHDARIPLSIANDLALGAHSVYATVQRTVTTSFLRRSGIDYSTYLKRLYDSSNYSRYVDTARLIEQLDRDLRPVRAFGALPPALKSFGFKRSHFVLEFGRWVVELPDRSVAYLHCASPRLQRFVDGVVRDSIELQGAWYHTIDGTEKEFMTPRFNRLLLGENGMLYAQYDNLISDRHYVIAVGLRPMAIAGVYEITKNDRLLRVDGAGRIHTLNTAGDLKVNVYATGR